MAKAKGARCIGILTSGGDCPGLNAAIRAVGKAAMGQFGMEVVGIRDGFRGLVENRGELMDSDQLSGILTLGGTVLRTSRDKPQRMPVGPDQFVDMTNVAVENFRRMHLDCLVCLGGGGTQKNALHLMKAGQIPVLTLPKTIDNDVAETDVSFGYDTAMTIAAEAIDRLHTTAESHHRLMVVEIMGHRTGWLALGAGVAGGADVILIPEIPYDLEAVAASVVSRNRKGKRFSIVALAEGALSKADAAAMERALAAATAEKAAKGKAQDGGAKGKAPSRHAVVDAKPAADILPGTVGARIAARLQEMTGLESRVTVLGHLQRGGTPSPFDRLLATRLGVAAAKLLNAGRFGVMVASRGDQCVPVPLEQVAGKRKLVPLDHPLVETARLVGTCLGDQ